MHDPILDEAARIEEDALYTSQSNFVAATFYDQLNLMLGIPAVLAGAAAAGTIIADLSNVAAGILALAASLLAAVQTFINPQRRAADYNAQGAEYRDLQAAARVMRTIDHHTMNERERRARLDELLRRRTDLNRRNRPSERAFRKAQRKIAAGHPIHTVDTFRGSNG